MHMADALLTPSVGAAMWAVSAAVTAYSARKVQCQLDNRKIPLMGAIGAFVFAAQMINFAIPGTGSSGHLGGGLLLAILLGPHAAFLTLASVLTVQALFFADGGLLALGSNVFNLGFIPCYICYPLIYKTIVADTPEHKRIVCGSIVSAIIALQLGSLGVVLQTSMSNISALPFSTFLFMMQPIHLAIGLIEGLATAGIITFVLKARPEILKQAMNGQPLGNLQTRNIIIGLLAATFLSTGILALYASDHPDGLEWAIEKVAGNSETALASQNVHDKLERLQQKTSVMPDYAFKGDREEYLHEKDAIGTYTNATLPGFLGSLLVLSCSIFVGFILKKRKHTT